MKAPPLGFVFECKPIRVLDGDTIEVQTPHLFFPLTLRLVDCWCPESKINAQIRKRFGVEAARLEKECGLASKKALSEMMDKVKSSGVPLRAKIELLPGVPIMKQNTFDRWPGWLWLPSAPGSLVNEAMVESGLADATKADQEKRWIKMYGKTGAI